MTDSSLAPASAESTVVHEEVTSRVVRTPRPIPWTNIFLCSVLVLLVGFCLYCLWYWQEMFGLAAMTTIAMIILSGFAYLVPMNAEKNSLSIIVCVVIYVAFLMGLCLGTFPPFGQVARHTFWDKVVPGGISSVAYAENKKAPDVTKATFKNGVLDVTEVPTDGYVLQVKYFDVTGDPHFEVAETGSAKLPAKANGIQIRWLKGNRVTGWTEVPDTTPPAAAPAAAGPATVPPAAAPATGPAPTGPTPADPDPADPKPADPDPAAGGKSV